MGTPAATRLRTRIETPGGNTLQTTLRNLHAYISEHMDSQPDPETWAEGVIRGALKNLARSVYVVRKHS